MIRQFARFAAIAGLIAATGAANSFASTIIHAGRLIDGRSEEVRAKVSIVIDDGKIVETGTHRELLDKQGLFYELVQSQEALSSIVAVEG